MYMEILYADSKLKNRASFSQGSSALLHVDWSRDSRFISINTQAYELLFYNDSGKMITATETADEKWATWTRKIGFQVKGVFQGVDYSDVNTVCRDPLSKFVAVGYDDQCIRLFTYPCYIEKQVCKVYPGHSSHVTRIKFTSNYMVSLGGLDRTIIIWNVDRPQEEKKVHDGEESDGLDDLEEDVDLPTKAITRKPKAKPI
jgi:WD40 repeat protein